MEILCFSGWCFGTCWYYFPIHIWDVILPIDELIFFKIVKITNQFGVFYVCMYMFWLVPKWDRVYVWRNSKIHQFRVPFKKTNQWVRSLNPILIHPIVDAWYHYTLYIVAHCCTYLAGFLNLDIRLLAISAAVCCICSAFAVLHLGSCRHREIHSPQRFPSWISGFDRSGKKETTDMACLKLRYRNSALSAAVEWVCH